MCHQQDNLNADIFDLSNSRNNNINMTAEEKEQINDLFTNTNTNKPKLTDEEKKKIAENQTITIKQNKKAVQTKIKPKIKPEVKPEVKPEAKTNKQVKSLDPIKPITKTQIKAARPELTNNNNNDDYDDNYDDDYYDYCND